MFESYHHHKEKKDPNEAGLGAAPYLCHSGYPGPLPLLLITNPSGHSVRMNGVYLFIRNMDSFFSRIPNIVSSETDVTLGRCEPTCNITSFLLPSSGKVVGNGLDVVAGL